MAIGALAQNARMEKALDLETGRTVANIARPVVLNMVVRFGCGSDSGADRMAAGAVFGRVLEDTFHMALFATKGSMDIPEQESRSRMVERGRIGNYVCQGRRRQEQECTRQ